MTRDPRFDVLFEPIRIGPVTARNRFYQVPHCTGMGWLRPNMLAEMRGVKAEGGWAVVCTEYCSIHPSSDDLPHASASLWDEDDVRAHRLMTDKVHAHGGLAGVELWHGGARSPNNFTRLPAMDVANLPNLAGHPSQTRAMDKADIRDLRRWHRRAALRAKEAGFDIVYVYATHGYLLANFLDPRINDRGDDYGGSLENRVRLVRELIEETHDAVGDRCAVAVRWKADERAAEDGTPETGERRDMFALLAELPDLWDVNISDYSWEMGTSRFTPEGALEPYMAWVKQATSKPVVTVGRFTSPDAMADHVRRGLVDLVGAARPSIADPFLPRKIEEGRPEDIRECIGCNICYSGDSLGVPIRCTQNPAMGEEWRRGWHPERIAPASAAETVLVVGAGPAGLEAARALGAKGHDVILAEAGRELGGRVVREAWLPGLAPYIRVRDHREQAFAKLSNVQVFRESRMSAQDVFDVAPQHVVIATGAEWRRDRFDGAAWRAVATGDARPMTPDDIMDGERPEGPVVVFDQDGYVLGGVIAEALAREGLAVNYVTESDSVSAWAGHTTERWRVRARLMELGVEIATAQALTAWDGAEAELVCGYSGAERRVAAAGAVLVTQRIPRDGLYHDLLAEAGGEASALPFTLTRIGDAEAPGLVAQAVHAGRRYAEELGADIDPDAPVRHERPQLEAPVPRRPAAPLAAAAAAETSALHPDYLPTLLRYWEEEIEGEAYFRALAERLPEPREKERMILLAEVERRTAADARPLIDRHGLSPAPEAQLIAAGRAAAAAGPQDWPTLFAEMRRAYPGYVAAFEALEALGPAPDHPLLARMTEHEVCAVAFLEAEAAGAPDATAPLLRFLCVPPVAPAPA